MASTAVSHTAWWARDDDRREVGSASDRTISLTVPAEYRRDEGLRREPKTGSLELQESNGTSEVAGTTSALSQTDGTVYRTSNLAASPSWMRTRPGAVASSASHPVAEWHGQVSKIYENFFVAELHGIFGESVSGTLEEAQIPIDEVDPNDRDLLREGAFFRLCIGYEISTRGNRRKFTEVIFRRMPAYRQEELEMARQQASALARAIQVA